VPVDVVEGLARLVREAGRIAVLSGAGISTASGIPDFRSAGGLYADERNVNVFDLAEFRRNPRLFYDFARRFYPRVLEAEPNRAHEVLAEWERDGRILGIATQNVDGFHERAGSVRVHPVHGSFVTSTCLSCGRCVETVELESVVFAGEIPHCGCGGVFKPDITFFGELLPEEAWTAAVETIAAADLLLVIGTSLLVYPAAMLPAHRRRGVRMAILNRDATSLDGEADVVCGGDIVEVMDAVNKAL